MIDNEHPKLKGFPLLPVTVVGSYPLSPDPDALMRSYYAKEDPFRSTIKQCIREQAEAGVQIVSDGQTRANMVNIFASNLAGIRMKGKPQVFKEINYAGPITIADQEYARKIIEEMVEGGGGAGEARGDDWLGAKGGGERNGRPGEEGGDQEREVYEKPLLKGIITGPHTMSQSVTDTYYKDEKELAFAFARALNREARALQEVAPILQIDEPFFSVNFIDYSMELITEMLEGITIPVSLHACGDVGAIFEDLIELPVTILDHEFTANPHLLDAVKGYDFPQMVGVGVVRSDHNLVEPVEWIRKRIESAVKAFGVERIMVDPDCGLRHVDREVAFGKLKNLRKARDRVVETLS